MGDNKDFKGGISFFVKKADSYIADKQDPEFLEKYGKFVITYEYAGYNIYIPFTDLNNEKITIPRTVSMNIVSEITVCDSN